MKYIKTSKLVDIINALPDVKTYPFERYIVELIPPLQPFNIDME